MCKETEWARGQVEFGSPAGRADNAAWDFSARKGQDKGSVL